MPFTSALARVAIGVVAVFLGFVLLFAGAGAGVVAAVLRGAGPVMTVACPIPANGSGRGGAGSGAPWGLDATQTGNARTIIGVGQSMGLPTYAEVVAIATALQESDLYNLNHGDRDSLGLFQQRPSQGWGTPAQIMDPVYAATAFYKALLQVPNWQQQPLTVDAQDVQHSATPDAYARWQTEATDTVTALAGSACSDALHSIATSLDSSGGLGARAAIAALRWVGDPYAYGGGTYSGPSYGFCQSGGGGGWLNGECVAPSTLGFDCSGLTMYAWYQATGGAIRLPHNAAQQFHDGVRVSLTALQPGDLIFYAGSDGTPTAPGHVVIYAGAGKVVDAPETGQSISVHELAALGMPVGAVRP